MNLQASDVVDVIFELKPEVLDLNSWISDYLVDTQGMSDLAAGDALDVVRPRVHSEITKRLERHRRQGTLAPLVYDEVSGMFYRPGDIRSLDRRTSIRSTFSDITGTQFEQVCQFLIDFYGASQSARIGRAGDRGIDVVAKFREPSRAGAQRLRSFPFRLLAQCKLRANNDLDADVVDAFATRLDAVRRGGEIHQVLPTWFHESSEPVLGVVMTAGRLTPAARRSASQAIIVTLEGDQIAEDLSHCPQAPTWHDSETGLFRPDLFLEAVIASV